MIVNGNFNLNSVKLNIYVVCDKCYSTD